jgi:hypothetical protein
MDMKNSNHYNPFEYTENANEVCKMTNFFLQRIEALEPIEVFQASNDPLFAMDMLFLRMIFLYVFEKLPKEERKFEKIAELFNEVVDENNRAHGGALCALLYGNPEAKMSSSLPITPLFADYLPALFRHPHIFELTASDDMELDRIGKEKTAILCVTEKEDRLFPPIIKILEIQILKYAEGTPVVGLCDFSENNS